jgi:hypothetical protein
LKESLPVRAVKKKPILVGYIAAVVTIELLVLVAQMLNWIK